MFVEFFCRARWQTLLVAWGGLIGVLGYSVFLAWVKSSINTFYSEFYDTLQMAGSIALGSDSEGSGSDGAYSADAGSGLFAPAAPPAPPSLADYRARVWEQLYDFAWIVAPLVWAAPAAKWLRSAWAFSWRMALMRAYLEAWDASKEPIEGASQRLHEDSQRFSNALQGCLATVLDAVFTLVVFTPILFDLSSRIASPIDVGPLNGGWLWLLALGAAVVGLGGAMFFGQRLVFLEVNNQRVEAVLRKDLVLLETTPAVIVGVPHSDQQYAPWLYFGLTLGRLSSNYHSLFRHFSLVNLWLSLYDQCMVLLPYFLAAPMLFAEDPASRITLGTLIQMSNSFDKVFSSLSIIAEGWTAINEFRSVLVRLREFEARLYLGVMPGDPPPGTHRAATSSRQLLPAARPRPSPPGAPPSSPPRSAPSLVMRWRKSRPLCSTRRVTAPCAPQAPRAPEAPSTAAATAAATVVHEEIQLGINGTYGPCDFSRPSVVVDDDALSHVSHVSHSSGAATDAPLYPEQFAPHLPHPLH